MPNHPFDPALFAAHAKNMAVFEETMQICREEFYVTPSGARVSLPTLREVADASVFYRDVPAVDSIPRAETSEIDAVNADCIDVARQLVEEGYRPILLNMANRHVPGGGVLNGARAQEETLFRRSNLCVSLYRYSRYEARVLGVRAARERYPMDPNTGGIYSGRTLFFRAGVNDGYALLERPFSCAVVSVAALNGPKLDANGRLVEWAANATRRKIRTMLRIGLLHGHDAIVLGAWGCGAFRNPPEHMAELFHETLHEPEFAGKFRRVRFAIIEDHNTRHSNFTPFANVFNAPIRSDGLRMPASTRLPDGFPERLTAEMLSGFRQTANGCTHPRAGEIDGIKYIAKCGSWSLYSSDEHVHNEIVADTILRAAGLHVPPSREYRVDFRDGLGEQTVRLARIAENSIPLWDAWNFGGAKLRAKIRNQAIAAYPVQAWIAGIDTFTPDNVRVDADGTLLFVDNGASFDFRACGKRKGWFWNRVDIADPATGYLSLAEHPNQEILRTILGPISRDALWSAAKRYDFSALVRQLPDLYQRPALAVYSSVLDAVRV